MKNFKKKDKGSIFMMKKGFLLIVCILFFSIIVSSFVISGIIIPTPAGEGTCVDTGGSTICRTPEDRFSGDISNSNSYLPAVSSGSVNGINGNLVLSETDFSLGGRNGLGFTVTRTYNSNIYMDSGHLSNQGILDSLIKPGPFGYGWNFDMGMIKLKENSLACDDEGGQYIVNTESYVKFPDGSIARFVNDSDDQYYGSDLMLDNLAKVNVYNQRFPGKFVQPTGYYEVVDNGNRYIFNHWVDIGWEDEYNNCHQIDRISGGNNYWTDFGSLREQHNYVGVYLTKIIDKWGNYIEVEYQQQTLRDPNGDETTSFCEGILSKSQCFGYNDAEHPMYYGSPFIKSITGPGGKVDFHIQVPSGVPPAEAAIRTKYDYIEYENTNGEKNIINYTYTGDTEYSGPAYACHCEDLTGEDQQLCNELCDENSLLAEVKIQDENGELLYPSTSYSYSHEFLEDSKEKFKLIGLKSTSKGIIDYEYQDFPFCTSGPDKYLNMIKGYELSDGVGSSYEYSYDYWDEVACGGEIDQSYLRGFAEITPADDSGDMTIVKKVFFNDITSGTTAGNIEWRAGVLFNSSVHESRNYIYESPYNHQPTEGWSSTMKSSDQYFYEPLDIGDREIYTLENSVWINRHLPWVIPVQKGVLKSVYDTGIGGGVKKYFVKYENIDEYGNVGTIKNYGEVIRVTSDYGSVPLWRSDLSVALTVDDYSPEGNDDNVRTEISYIYNDLDYIFNRDIDPDYGEYYIGNPNVGLIM